MHNYFNTITIEVVNQLNRGWIRETKQEVVISQFDIRIPDIKHLYDEENQKSVNDQKRLVNELGFIKLPLDEFLDYRKMGMKYIENN